MGIGKRYLIDNDTTIVGANVFVDRQLEKEHQRASIGLEYKKSNFKINANRYYPISDEKEIGLYAENVMPGYDIRITGQVPYIPWAKLNYNKYKWSRSRGHTGFIRRTNR